METSERPWGRAVGKVLRAAAKRVGPRGVLEAGLRIGPYKGLTLGKLEKNPHGIDLGPLRPRLPDALYTRDKKVDLAPRIYLRDSARLSERYFGEHPADGLVLIGRRHLRSNNSWMHNSHRLVKGKPRCVLLMHPDDAAARGLEAGDRVRVASRVGEVIAPVELTDEMMPGVVSLPHGWGHDRPGVELRVAREHAGVSVNDITDEGFYDRLSGTSSLNAVPVEVAKAG